MVGYGLEDLGDELLREERRALGLARGTEIPCLAGEREQMLAPTFRAAQARETPDQASTVEKRLHRWVDDTAERAS
jgi:hypothetical protein